MSRISFIAILAMLLIAAAPITKPLSQPPIPRTAVSSDKYQQKAIAGQQPATQYERGTQAAPVFIKSLGGPNDEARAAEYTQDRQDRTSSDRWNLRFSALLVLVGILQGVSLAYTAYVSNKAANAAKKSAEVSERALTDLEGPFLFPIVQTDSLRNSFEPFILYGDQDFPVTPVRPEIAFVIKNHGRTPAFPQTIAAVFFFGQPQDNHHDALAGHVHQPLIGPGDTSSMAIRRKMIQPIGTAEYRAIVGRTSRIYLRGSVIFLDIFGNRYEQTFCLAWDKDAKAFFVWGPQRNQRKRILGN